MEHLVSQKKQSSPKFNHNHVEQSFIRDQIIAVQLASLVIIAFKVWITSNTSKKINLHECITERKEIGKI